MLADGIKRLVSQRREAMKRTSKASGVIENYGEKNVIIYDLIKEIDEKDEMLKSEKNENIEKEMRLVSVGDNLRELALRRIGSSSMCTSGMENTSGGAAFARKKRSRPQEAAKPDEESISKILLQAEERRGL